MGEYKLSASLEEHEDDVGLENVKPGKEVN
jgi:hypothetical protein